MTVACRPAISGLAFNIGTRPSPRLGAPCGKARCTRLGRLGVAGEACRGEAVELLIPGASGVCDLISAESSSACAALLSLLA